MALEGLNPLEAAVLPSLADGGEAQLAESLSNALKRVRASRVESLAPGGPGQLWPALILEEWKGLSSRIGAANPSDQELKECRQRASARLKALAPDASGAPHAVEDERLCYYASSRPVETVETFLRGYPLSEDDKAVVKEEAERACRGGPFTEASRVKAVVEVVRARIKGSLLGEFSLFLERTKAGISSPRSLKKLARSPGAPPALRSALEVFAEGSFSPEDLAGWIALVEKEELAWKLLVSEWKALADAGGASPRRKELRAARAHVREKLSGLGVKLRKAGDVELDSFACTELFAPEKLDAWTEAELSRAARPFATAKKAPGEEALHGMEFPQQVREIVRARAAGEIESREALAQLAQAEMVDCVAVCWKRFLRPLAARIHPRDPTPEELLSLYPRAQTLLHSLREDLRNGFPSPEEFRSYMDRFLAPAGDSFVSWAFSCYEAALPSPAPRGEKHRGAKDPSEKT